MLRPNCCRMALTLYGVGGLKKLCIAELLLRKHGKKWRHCLTQSIMQEAAVKTGIHMHRPARAGEGQWLLRPKKKGDSKGLS